MQAFFYVDGIPTKGTWVDMDTVESRHDILEALAKKGLIYATILRDGSILCRARAQHN